MSAFVVPDEHIDAMLTAAKILCRPYGPFRWYWKLNGEMKSRNIVDYQPQGADPENPVEPMTAIGRMLLRENHRSVDHRYEGRMEHDLADSYTFRELPGYPDPVLILKAIACYEYQACETDDFEQSEAFAFCQALRGTAIHKLPGYDDAEGWTVTRRDVFTSLPKGRRQRG